MSDLKANYFKVLAELKNDKSKLICVSKTKPSALIRELYELGHRDFGENKVQELEQKADELRDLSEMRWHFIGHLQSNKINQLLKIPNIKSIHSIDSLKLLEKILSKSPKNKMGLFLQVNTSGEEQKSGFETLEELQNAALKFHDNNHFFLQGLMTIGRIRTDNFEQDARECFKALGSLKDQLGADLELSMGMSSDYKIALDYGSHYVRVGSSIFGPREL